jgi:hypothetical protein
MFIGVHDGCSFDAFVGDHVQDCSFAMFVGVHAQDCCYFDTFVGVHSGVGHFEGAVESCEAGHVSGCRLRGLFSMADLVFHAMGSFFI